MTPYKLSFVLIPLVLALALYVPRLNAEQPNNPELTQNNAASTPPSPGKRNGDQPPQKQSEHKSELAAEDKRGADPVPPIKILEAPKAESSPAQAKQHPSGDWWPDWWPDWRAETYDSFFSFLIILVAIFQAVLFLWQLKLLERSLEDSKTTSTAALQQATAIKLSERAYVKISYSPPGLNHSMASGDFWLNLQIANFGRTPATITEVAIKHQCLGAGQRLPDVPDYSESYLRPTGAFLVTNDVVTIAATGPFISSNFREDEITEAVKLGRVRFVIFGYVDYIDVFGKGHRAGYAREFNYTMDWEGRSDYAQRNNLVFVHEHNYNYDKERT